MIRKIKTDRIVWLDSHPMSQTPRQIFNACLQLSKGHLLSRRTIDKSDPIVIPGRGIVAGLLPVKHERIDVRVGSIGYIAKWSLDDMVWIDLDICHGVVQNGKRLLPNQRQQRGTFMFGSRDINYRLSA